jgi:hypothetical protein
MELSDINRMKGKSLSDLLAGTGAVGGNAGQIGSRLGEVNKKIAEESLRQQELRIGGANDQSPSVINSMKSLKSLNLESQKLQMALKQLTDVSDEAASIQKTLNRLDEQKKTRYGLAEQFVFGSEEDKRKINQSISDAINLSIGRISLSSLSDERKAGVLSIGKQFSNTPAAMFGIGPRGGAATGTERIWELIKEQLKNIPGVLGALGQQGIEDLNPNAPNRQEDAAIKQLEALFVQRKEAEIAFLANFEASNDKLANSIEKSILSLNGQIISAIETSETNRVQRELNIKESKLSTGKSSIDALDEATKYFQSSLSGKDISRQGSLRMLQFFGDPKEQKRIEEYRKNLPYRGEVGLSKNLPIKEGTPSDIINLLQTAVSSADKTSQQAFTNSVKESIKPLFDRLSNAGLLSADKIDITSGEVAKKLLAIYNAKDKVTQIGNVAIASPSSNEEKMRQIADRAFSDILLPLNKAISDEMKKTEKDFASSAGVDTDNIDAFIGVIEKLPESIGKWATATKELKSETIDDVAKSISNLATEIDSLKNVLNGTSVTTGTGQAVTPQHKALGGRMKARGTDTIPAMLSPGEFIVNSHSANKNRNILEAINSGKAVYAASGGQLDKNYGMWNFFKSENLTDDKFDLPKYSDEEASNRAGEVGRARGLVIGGLLSLIPQTRLLRTIINSTTPKKLRKNAQKGFGNLVPGAIAGMETGEDLARKDFKKYGGTYNLSKEDRFRKGAGNAFRLPLKGQTEPSYNKENAKKAMMENRTIFEMQMSEEQKSNYEGTIDKELDMQEKLHYYAAKKPSKTLSQVQKEARIAAQNRSASILSSKEPLDFGSEIKNNEKDILPRPIENKVFSQPIENDISPKEYKVFEPENFAVDDRRREVRLKRNSAIAKPKSEYQMTLDSRKEQYQKEMERRREAFKPSSAFDKSIKEAERTWGKTGSIGIPSRTSSLNNVGYVSSNSSKSPFGEAGKDFTDNFENMLTKQIDLLSKSLEGIGLEKASLSMRESANIFQTSISSFPATMLEAISPFNMSVENLSKASDGFGSNISELAKLIADISVSSSSISDAAKEMKDALSQEIAISVSHKHDPITVIIEDGSSSVQSGDLMKDFVISVVGPEIDKLRDRIRDVGLGIA